MGTAVNACGQLLLTTEQLISSVWVSMCPVSEKITAHVMV